MTDLTPLQQSNSVVFAISDSINDSDEILVNAYPSLGNRVFLYHAGKTTYLKAGSFDGASLNNRGQIIGITTKIYPASLNQEVDSAFLYSPGKTISIPPPPGCIRIQFAKINNSGHVLGEWITPSGGEQACLYDTHTKKMTMFKTISGFPNGYCVEINDRDEVLGLSEMPFRIGCHAVIWENGKTTDLGILPGQQASCGLAINNHGEAVGVSGSDVGFLSKFLGRYVSYGSPLRRFINTHSEERAFVYHDGKMTDLNSLIPSGSHWTLEQATGINDTGQIIGNGLHNGKERAFLLTPIESSK